MCHKKHYRGLIVLLCTLTCMSMLLGHAQETVNPGDVKDTTAVKTGRGSDRIPSLRETENARLQPNGTITVQNNNFESNSTYGVQSSIPITAENNWWGDASGPYHPTLNPGGQGGSVSDNVDFQPWRTSAVGIGIPLPPLPQPGAITIVQNNLEDNGSYGIQSSIPIAAENNWWGDASGPYHPTLNPGGQGDSASGNVDFQPWRTSAVDIGILLPPLPQPGALTIVQNNLEDNGSYGIQSSIPITAENNWWGDASGPYHPTLNPGGQGDRVSDNVDFQPWRTSAVDIGIPLPPTTCSISGHVRDGNGNPMAGVVLSTNTGGFAVTDASGAYIITGLTPGTYTLVPSKGSYKFSPVSRTVSVPPSATGQDFTAELGLHISYVEVIQAIQTITNSVPLIAGKPTVVRVHVINDTGTELNVWGTLYADDGSGPVEISAENAPVVAVENPERSNDHHALRFSLPQSMWSGSPTIYVEIYTNIAGSRIRYPASGVIDLSFNDVDSLKIGYVSIKYNGAVPDAGRIAGAYEYLESVYPLNKVDYFQVPMIVPYIERLWSEPISYLKTVRWWYDLLGWPQPNGEPDQLFGWVPHVTWGLDGDSDPKWFGGDGQVAYGSDTLTNTLYQVIMAHELGHNFGRRHPICDIPDPDWPYSDYAIHDVGFDFGVYSPNTLVSEETDDFMVGGHCGADEYDNKWVSAYTFQKLHEAVPGAVDLSMSHSLVTIATGQSVLLVGGRVYTDATAELDAAYQLTATQAVSQSVGTDYCLRLENGGSAVLSASCFDLSFIDSEWGITQPVASFVRVLPYDPAAARLVLAQRADELAERVISANSPTVTLQVPNGGRVISGTVDVTWTAGDTDGDSLSYAVSYSSDSGQSWYHLGMGITDTHLLVDTGILQGSDQALFRVVASDGINTTYDVSDAVSTIPSHTPEAFVLSPDDGITLAASQTLLLRGRGYDLEDGTLADDMLNWTSSLSGILGSGRVLAVSGLPVGTHIITLTVTDSDGQIGKDTTAVIITSPYSFIYLPLVLRNH